MQRDLKVISQLKYESEDTFEKAQDIGKTLTGKQSI